VAACVVFAAGVELRAADRWIEVRSPHFTVVSNASDGETRDIAWQLEQIRSVLGAAYPWARLELDHPLTVIALKDENSMRALAPRSWEQRGGVRPAAVWAAGVDQYFMALRADERGEERQLLNPYRLSFFSYVSLVLQNSVDRPLPDWALRGLAGVWSNTIIRTNEVVIGAPIRDYMRELRDGGRFPLQTIVSPRPGEIKGEIERWRFDMQAWGLVHFLMFDNKGARASALTQYIRRIGAGAGHAAAFEEVFGSVDALESPLRQYLGSPIQSMAVLEIDVRVRREALPVRVLPHAEHAAVRAAFQVVMFRAADARQLLQEARTADASLTTVDVVEAGLFEIDNRLDEARAALTRAIERGSKDAAAHFRLARLLGQGNADRETLQRIDTLLSATINIDNRHAAAYAYLADVRFALTGSPNALALIRRAIALRPRDAGYYLIAARVLRSLKRPEEARKDAAMALQLAASDDERQQAQRLIETLNGQ
jgi:tetratricopeptide (TPR) repeat protein